MGNWISNQKVLIAYRNIKCKYHTRFKCYIDFSIDGEKDTLRRIVIELRGNFFCVVFDDT